MASRKAALAEAQGNAAAAMEEKARLGAEATKAQAEALAASKKKVQGLEGDVARSKAEVSRQKNETEKERAARGDAERKAQEAMAALEKSLSVSHEERGTVITLSGSLLFGTGKSTLLPGAKNQLDQVAEALETQSERHFVVEGHTDDQGTVEANAALFQRRGRRPGLPGRARRRGSEHHRRRQGPLEADRRQQDGRGARHEPSGRDHRAEAGVKAP